MNTKVFIIVKDKTNLAQLIHKIKYDMTYNSLKSDQLPENMTTLRSILKKHNFPFQNCTKSDINQGFRLQLNPLSEPDLQESRKHYFKNTWSTMQSIFQKNMENTFANDQTFIDLIQEKLHSSRPIQIYTDHAKLTMDEFIRTMEPNQVYYVATYTGTKITTQERKSL